MLRWASPPAFAPMPSCRSATRWGGLARSAAGRSPTSSISTGGGNPTRVCDRDFSFYDRRGSRAEVVIVAKIGRERRLRVLEGGVSATTSVPHLALGDRVSALALAEK